MKTKQINIRSLQHYSGKLFYNNYSIVLVDKVVESSELYWRAENTVCSGIIIMDTLEQVLDEIDTYTNITQCLNN